MHSDRILVELARKGIFFPKDVREGGQVLDESPQHLKSLCLCRTPTKIDKNFKFLLLLITQENGQLSRNIDRMLSVEKNQFPLSVKCYS